MAEKMIVRKRPYSLSIKDINSTIARLGGEEGVRQFAEGASAIVDRSNFRRIIVQDWIEKKGVIYFLLTSAGKGGTYWIDRLRSKAITIESRALGALRSPGFSTGTPGTFGLAVIRSSALPSGPVDMDDIRALGRQCKLMTPRAEAACLILDAFDMEQAVAMGMDWIMVAHTSISSDNGPFQFIASYINPDRRPALEVDYVGEEAEYTPTGRFAFEFDPATFEW